MLLLECFRDYHGYKVSNMGRVISPNGFELKQRINRKGYHLVNIKTPVYYRYGFLVHRLVAELFCDGKSEINNCVNHMDENPHNNRSDNLEWCSIWYNNHYGNGERRKARQRMQAEIYGKRVILFQGDEYHYFNSMGEASRFLGRDRKFIAKAIKSGQRTAMGWGLVSFSRAS